MNLPSRHRRRTARLTLAVVTSLAVGALVWQLLPATGDDVTVAAVAPFDDDATGAVEELRLVVSYEPEQDGSHEQVMVVQRDRTTGVCSTSAEQYWDGDGTGPQAPALVSTTLSDSRRPGTVAVVDPDGVVEVRPATLHDASGFADAWLSFDPCHVQDDLARYVVPVGDGTASLDAGARDRAIAEDHAALLALADPDLAGDPGALDAALARSPHIPSTVADSYAVPHLELDDRGRLTAFEVETAELSSPHDALFLCPLFHTVIRLEVDESPILSAPIDTSLLLRSGGDAGA